MSDDPQDVAESLDDDVVGTTDDRTGDEFGDAFADYPPDRPSGVDARGVTPVEEDAGESLAERVEQEQPEDLPVDPDDAPGRAVSSEEAAVHVEPER